MDSIYSAIYISPTTRKQQPVYSTVPTNNILHNNRIQLLSYLYDTLMHSCFQLPTIYHTSPHSLFSFSFSPLFSSLSSSLSTLTSLLYLSSLTSLLYLFSRHLSSINFGSRTPCQESEKPKKNLNSSKFLSFSFKDFLISRHNECYKR